MPRRTRRQTRIAAVAARAAGASSESQPQLGEAEIDPRVEDSDLDSDDDEVVLLQPDRALESRKYSQVLRELFHNVVEAVDRSPLPYFKGQIKHSTQAMHDFVVWLFEIHRDDGFIEDDDAVETPAASQSDEREPPLDDCTETEQSKCTDDLSGVVSDEEEAEYESYDDTKADFSE